MDSNVICYHHNDLDGQCSAYLVRRFYSGEVKCIEVDYGIDYDLSEVGSNDIVYLVDFRFLPEEVEFLLENAKKFIWIDHHKTSINMFSDFGREIEGLREVGKAGCVLTYEYLFLGDKEKREENIPEYVRLLGDWDVWTFKYGEKTKHFQYYMKGRNTSPDSFIWDKLHINDAITACNNVSEEVLNVSGEDFYSKIIEYGKEIYNSRLTYFDSLLERFGYDVEFEGYKAKVCNAGFVSSELFRSAKDEYDLFIAYAFDGSLFKVSLSSTKIDTSEIAKKYGGGGHSGASGFNCEELPF